MWPQNLPFIAGIEPQQEMHGTEDRIHQLSLRNGAAGSPAWLNKPANGALRHA